MISYYLSCDSWGDGKSICLWRTEDNKSIKVARFQNDTIAKKIANEFNFPLSDKTKKKI